MADNEGNVPCEEVEVNAEAKSPERNIGSRGAKENEAAEQLQNEAQVPEGKETPNPFSTNPILVVDNILRLVRNRSLEDLMALRQTSKETKAMVDSSWMLFQDFRVALDPTQIYSFMSAHPSPSIPFGNFSLRPFYSSDNSRNESLIHQNLLFPSFVSAWASRIRTLDIDVLNIAQSPAEADFYSALQPLSSFTTSYIDGRWNDIGSDGKIETQSSPILEPFKQLETLRIIRGVSYSGMPVAKDLFNLMYTNKHLTKVALPLAEAHTACLKAYTNFVSARRGSSTQFQFDCSTFLKDRKVPWTEEEAGALKNFLTAVAASAANVNLIHVSGHFMSYIGKTFEWKLVKDLLNCVVSIVNWYSLPFLMGTPTPRLSTVEITSDDKTKTISKDSFPAMIPLSVTRLALDFHSTDPLFSLPNKWPTTLKTLHLEMVHTREEWAQIITSVGTQCTGLKSLSIVACPHNHDMTVPRTPFLDSLTAFKNLEDLKVELLRCPIQICSGKELPLRDVIRQLPLRRLELLFNPLDCDDEVDFQDVDSSTEHEMAGELQSLTEGRISSTLLRFDVERQILPPLVDQEHPSIAQAIKKVETQVDENRMEASIAELETVDKGCFIFLQDFYK